MPSQDVRALEFFCGIGGMRCALKSVAPQAVVLDAFDVSPIANEVYMHNFGKKINKLDLECITPQQLDAYAANLWMLSPPCQPHTRQGQQKGSQDHRSNAFQNLLTALAHMQQPPQWLMLENVVGFDHSDVHKLMVKALQDAGYHMQEFILSPLQYGIPYTRPRYFCLASKLLFPVEVPSGTGPCQATPALLLQLRDAAADQQTIQAAAQQHLASHVRHVQTISEYLWNSSGQQQQQQQAEQLHASCSLHGCNHTGNSIGSSCPQLPNFQVPESILTKYPGILRVVTGSSRNSSCFTKSYSQFARGTGSLLAEVDPVGTDPSWQLAGGVGSLIHCSSSSKGQPAGHTVGVDASRLQADGAGDPAALTAASNMGQQVMPECSDGCAQITLRPGEMLLTAEEQQYYAGATPSRAKNSSIGFSLQHLLLHGADVTTSTVQNSLHSCSTTTSSSNSSSSSNGSHLSNVASRQPPVVLRPGELVIAAEERQQYTDQAVQQLADAWQKLGIRYFTPIEIARFHSFPADYRFPPSLTVKQCYQLLGNSLSVAVVADLLRYMLMAG